MSEVLSQSQIDALLNAVRSGEKDVNQQDEAKPEQRYRKYNFKDPRKFTKDRIKMLNGIFENYTRIINSRLNAMLHTNCEVRVESIEEQRYYEFSNALSDEDVLALAEVRTEERIEEEPLMLYLSTSMVLTVLDHLMGGEGDVDENITTDYSYTDLELKLYETVATDLISVMGNSWENYINVQFEYTRTEVNPTFAQFIGLDEIVVIVDLKFQFPNCSGRMSIIMPASVLSNIFAEINKRNPGIKTTTETYEEEIFDTLRESTLEIVAELGNTRLTLDDLYHLSVGDVIDLGQPKDSAVSLGINGQRWFSGHMGVHKKNMAVKIDDVCYQAEQRSE